MTILVGKLDYLVLDRGTVPRADAFDLSGIQRRFMKILANALMELARGVTDIAIDLRLLNLVG